MKKAAENAPGLKNPWAPEPACKVLGSGKRCSGRGFGKEPNFSKKAEFVFNKISQTLTHPIGNTVLSGAIKSPLTNGKYTYHTYAVQDVQRPEGLRHYLGEMPKSYDPGFGKQQAAINAMYTAYKNPADSITTKTYNNLVEATKKYNAK